MSNAKDVVYRGVSQTKAQKELSECSRRDLHHSSGLRKIYRGCQNLGIPHARVVTREHVYRGTHYNA